MTRPFPRLLIVKTPEKGWVFQELSIMNDPTPQSEYVNIDACVRTLPDFEYYVNFTTAGWRWKDHLLAFSTSTAALSKKKQAASGAAAEVLAPREVAVVCFWWGQRLLIDLKTRTPMQADAASIETVIQAFVLQGLKDTVTAMMSKKGHPEYPWGKPRSNTWVYPTSFAHHAGILQMEASLKPLIHHSKQAAPAPRLDPMKPTDSGEPPKQLYAGLESPRLKDLAAYPSWKPGCPQKITNRD